MANRDLTHEQTPSLGTLFYMAPEQADLKAVPDARWDVYALGAILYCMLVGKPPHMSEELLNRIEAASDLPGRLLRYRQWITSHKPPDEHRKIPGVDRALASIVDRCLAPRPSKRFANVQEVLDALRTRDQARARRPLLLLGVLGPLLLLMVMAYGGWNVYQSALQESAKAVTAKVYSKQFVRGEIRGGQRGDRNPTLLPGGGARGSRSRTSPEHHRHGRPIAAAAGRTGRPTVARRGAAAKTRGLRGRGGSAEVAAEHRSLDERPYPDAASWFVCDERGTHLAGQFNQIVTSSIGSNFAYRTYCYGGLRDLTDRQARPMPDQHVRQTSLSAPLSSSTTKRWKIAVSTPLYREDDPQRLLAVLVLTVDVGNFMTFDATESQFAVLVDERDNGYQGMILDHPLLTKIYGAGAGLASEFSLSQYRVAMIQAPSTRTSTWIRSVVRRVVKPTYQVDRGIDSRHDPAGRGTRFRRAGEFGTGGICTGRYGFRHDARAGPGPRTGPQGCARAGRVSVCRRVAVVLRVPCPRWSTMVETASFCPRVVDCYADPRTLRSTAAERGADPPKS